MDAVRGLADVITLPVPGPGFIGEGHTAIHVMHNGFLYPIDGEITVDGTRPQRLASGQIGWLEFGGPSTTIRLTARTNGSRVMLYAGARQNVPIVTHGPFVGETHADLVRVSRAYAEGRMPRVSELGR